MMNPPTITWITADDTLFTHVINLVHQATLQPSSRCLQSANADDTYETIYTAWHAELNDGQLLIGTTGESAVGAEFHLEHAWVRGPFGNRAHAHHLWKALVQQLSVHVTTFDAFPHLDAHELIIFWQAQGFQIMRTVHVMYHTDPVVDAMTDGVYRATSVHRPAIAALHHRHFANTQTMIDDIFAEDDQHLLSVITAENDVVKGYAWWGVDTLDQSATLEYLAVADAYQRQGVAGNLVYHGLAWAYSQQLNSVKLTVDDDHAGAHALYQRCGFRIASSGVHLRWQKQNEAYHV
jgi:ribosomal protein S18 acetylase RimI-like enzyme